ncbi:uncharacterized protein LOC142684357 isoform X2 [Rhinoderma darwinii]
MEDRSLFQQSCSDGNVETSGICEPPVKRQRRYPRVNPVRWIKKVKKRKRRSSHRGRRSEEKMFTEDYQYKTPLEKISCDPSAGVTRHSASDLPDEPLLNNLFMKIRASKNLKSEEVSDLGTTAEPCNYPGEAVTSCEKQKDVSESSDVTRGARFTADTKNCTKTIEGSCSPSNLHRYHKKCYVDSGLDDSKDGPETSDILIAAKTDNPPKTEIPKSEDGMEETRSSTTNKKVSQRKKDKHVKFSEVVTMFLIEKDSEENSGEGLAGGVKLRRRRLPICNNEKDRKQSKFTGCKQWGGDEEEHRPSHGSIPRNVRKETTVSSCCPAEKAKSSTKCSKKMTVEGTDTPRSAPDRDATSPTKPTIKPRHQLHGVRMNQVGTQVGINLQENCRPSKESEDKKVETCPEPQQPKTPPNAHEQKFIKSYTCSNCGKITHWSKLSVHQKENIERSIAHLCKMCGCLKRIRSNSAAAQTISPANLSLQPQPGNGSKKMSAYSSPEPNTQSVLPAEKRQKRIMNEKIIVTAVGMVTANDQRSGANRDDFQKPPPKCPEQNKPNVCSKCQNLGASVDPKLKAITGSLSNNTSTSDTLPLGLDSRRNKIGTRDKKVASKTSDKQPGKTGDSRIHEVCTKCGEHFRLELKKNPPSCDQQKKAFQSFPAVLQKPPDSPSAPPKTRSTNVHQIRNPRRLLDAANPKSDNDSEICTKCGKSMLLHVSVNPENPDEGGEKNCVLRLKKKRKRPLEGMEPFQCKQCGKIFTRHFTLLQHNTVHTGERPYSCKECGKSFRDGGYLKIHMRLHTKEKPYTCSECGKSFVQNPALVTHMRTHTDEKPFQCSECGKSFRDRSTYRHHQRIHTGEKPFTCSFCGRKFTQQSHVKRHEKTHTGERPFGCTVCEKKFVDRTKLRKHELIHNRGNEREPKA